MNNGWTRGQYNIYRVVLGVYLLQHFLFLLPWGPELFSSQGVLPSGTLSPFMHLFPNIFWLCDSPFFVSAVLGVCALLSGCLTLGKWDRPAAFLLWYLWACFYGRNPLIGNPSMPFVGWLLLAHGVIAASGKTESAPSTDERDAQWTLPSEIYLAAWVLLALGYTYSGYTKLVSPSWVDGSALTRILANPLARNGSLRTLLLAAPPWALRCATWSALALELSFAPLALSRRARPWIWSAMVAMHLGLALLINFADLTAGMLLAHLFTFDPAWMPARQSEGEIIFFDGECGLCHGFVRFVLRENHAAQPFSFAPLQGQFVREIIPDEVRNKLPDSIVLARGERILVKSDAVLYVLARLGGLWTLLSTILRIVPSRLLDVAYDHTARLRKTIGGAKGALCPLAPALWRMRFRE